MTWCGQLWLPVLLAFLVGPSFMSSGAKTWEVTPADSQPTVPSLLSAVVGTSDSSSLKLTSTLYSKVRMIFPPHANLYKCIFQVFDSSDIMNLTPDYATPLRARS